ncbi:MAG: FMN adenylyltransferase [Candidatus Tokpelaia hoelldobleri]|uniref:Riboflavin biosynthesis protein n=1 Tax=Candidatus Tokpelaia hoelldobleri TaxID=1902579 RepID=A0A1U9JTI3_9HYPH|nr:MAG: FMN adenylyltransferase [Candidatus Tokpelaia hoelldoblerii]
MKKTPFLRLEACHALPDFLKGAVVAIGNFDGVHRGHQAVLQNALALARTLGKPAVVLTFEPHPRAVFAPDMPLARLTPAVQKAEILRILGFDAVVEQHFDRAFAARSAEFFVQSVLCGTFAASAVVVGDNFHYGSKRQGNAATLTKAGAAHGFAVRIIPSFYDSGGAVVSSSRIRKALARGAVENAADLLGYHYTLSGKVIHGAALGRTLGFPTANMRVVTQAAPAFGVYTVRLRRADGRLYDGVASFGLRPTVNELSEPLFETFIFDFSEDIYGEPCAVSCFARLRGEKKFDGLEPLIAQMKRDEKEARAILAKAVPLSLLDKHFCFDQAG